MTDKKRISLEDLNKELEDVGIVNLILERDFDSSKGMHPVEEHLRSKAIPYYFKEGNKEDYCLDLNKVEIVY